MGDPPSLLFFFFNDTATTEIYTLSLHDALPIYPIEGTYQHIQHYRFFSNNTFLLGNSRITVNLGYAYSHRREFAHPQALYIPGLNLQLNTYTYDVKYYFPQFSGWNISFCVY